MGTTMERVIRYYEKAHTLEQLYDGIRDTVHFKSYLRTAAESGWFINGLLVTKLTDDEKKWMKERLEENPDAKDAPVFLTRKILKNHGSGPPLKVAGSYAPLINFPYYPPLVCLVSQFKDYTWVRTWMYTTLRQRHPLASFYMTGWYGAQEKPIVVAIGNKTVGMLMPYNVL